MPTLYAVRLTCSNNALWDDDETSFGQYLLERFETVIIYEHVGTVNENVHIHLLLRSEDQAPTPDAMRKSEAFKRLNLSSREHSFKSSFKNKQTKEAYPMTDDNCEKYITYMTKGCLDPEFVSFESKWDLKRCLRLRDAWVVPMSKTATKVAAFAKYLGAEQPPFPSISNPDPAYEWLKNKVWSYVMNKYDGFDVACANEFRMLLITFMFKRGIKAPEKTKHYI